MRKRWIVLAALAAVAGFAALGTVLAQPPGGTFTPAKSSGTLPATTVRPYGEWSPTQPGQPGAGTNINTGTRPAGGSFLPPPGGAQPATYPPANANPNRPRPGVAGADPVRPASGVSVPPPNFELPGTRPVGTPPNPLPPPSVSVDPSDSKFGSSPPPVAPLVPVPPPSGLVPPPAFPATPAFPSTPVNPPKPQPTIPAPPAFPALPGSGGTPVVPVPGSGTPSLPGTVTPSTPVLGATLPSRVSQSVTVDAICPDTVVFNSEFRYELVVRNTGDVAVQNVRVEDELPAGVRYVGSDPPGESNGDRLVWALGTLDSKAEKRIAVRVRPTEEGDLRSRASVTYTATVDVKTKVTRPRVGVAVTCPEGARAGEEATFRIKVTNTGTGPAQQMVLKAMLTEGLDYRGQGNELVTKLSNLPAGETRTVDLPLTALKSGLQSCQVTVTAEGSQDATTKATINVVEPMLQIAQTGPAKCLVRAEPTYEITLSNPGTASTDPITVQSVLPDGFDFVQASDNGTYSATTRTVTWKLNGLSPSGTKAVGVKLRAGVAGDVTLRTVAATGAEAPATGIAPIGGVATKPGRVLEAKVDTAIKAEGVAAVRFEVVDIEDPVEVGKEAIYEIRVVNQGTGACTNVQLMAALADGTTFTGSSGPTQAKAQGQTLVFEPIANLPVKGDAIYRVRVRGAVAGDQRFRVQITCDQVRNPVVKEESTRFYKE